MLVEKILTGDEQLPTAWPIAGTTGYDALAEIDRVLVDPRGRRQLDAMAARIRGSADGPVAWDDMIHHTKRAVADGILQSEVRRIERELDRAGGAPPGSRDVIAGTARLLPGVPLLPPSRLRAPRRCGRRRPDGGGRI